MNHREAVIFLNGQNITIIFFGLVKKQTVPIFEIVVFIYSNGALSVYISWAWSDATCEFSNLRYAQKVKSHT